LGLGVDDDGLVTNKVAQLANVVVLLLRFGFYRFIFVLDELLHLVVPAEGAHVEVKTVEQLGTQQVLLGVHLQLPLLLELLVQLLARPTSTLVPHRLLEPRKQSLPEVQVECLQLLVALRLALHLCLPLLPVLLGTALLPLGSGLDLRRFLLLLALGVLVLVVDVVAEVLDVGVLLLLPVPDKCLLLVLPL
jgi:hypothetical protein